MVDRAMHEDMRETRSKVAMRRLMDSRQGIFDLSEDLELKSINRVSIFLNKARFRESFQFLQKIFLIYILIVEGFVARKEQKEFI